jgi:hypothetical protein
LCGACRSARNPVGPAILAFATGLNSIWPMRSRLSAIFRDVQFWIPVIVLIVGLIVLKWIR